MKPFGFAMLICAVAALMPTQVRATERFVSLDGAHVTPFMSWADAATNIQAAVDAAVAGDVIWVTNGVYATGGKVMAGDLTNRVALDKPITVQSVNGPFVTTIQGNGATNGTAAVRCAWLTNGATLRGFTVRWGATRTSGDNTTLRSGGGVWCASTNATVANCLIITNACSVNGGGAYQGTVRNCLLTGNKSGSGGGAFSANLVNCTVTSNSTFAAYSCRLTNSIVCYNSTPEFSGSTLTYCFTLSPAPGVGNVAGNPRLSADGLHLANDSPCLAAGTNLATGLDIDGDAWANPPPMGCDQWQPAPRIVSSPQVQFANNPFGFSVEVAMVGEEPFTCWWFRDGTLLEDDGHYEHTHTTNLLANGVFPFDVGGYQVVVSNASGMVTSMVARAVGHYVDAAGTNPLPPYTSWATAATTIQDSINASLVGEFVFVTNGVYASGGKVKAGDLTNRVALDKALLVQSVNGPAETVIEGLWNPTVTNGPLAVRCAWLTNGAMLSGFTLRGGATRATGDSVTLQYGGGVWGASTNAIVFNCLLVTNTAAASGGGAYRITLRDSLVSGNSARLAGGGLYQANALNCSILTNTAGDEGGGAASGWLENCKIAWNTAGSYVGGGYGGGTRGANLRNCAVLQNTSFIRGSGVYYGTLLNCTVANNTMRGSFYGVEYATLTNCIVSGNSPEIRPAPDREYMGSTLSYCCATPLADGPGNIADDPLLLEDHIHLRHTSPCRGAGVSAVPAGSDLDGQAWESPASMGCDAWHPEPLVIAQPGAAFVGRPGTMAFGVLAAGQPPFTCWWTRDGIALEDGSHYSGAHTTNVLVSNLGPTDAGGYQVIISNAFEMATSQVTRLVVHCADAAAANPAPPYTSWATAANTIQDAIEAATPGDVVLVTDGVYASGGRVTEGGLTNRVLLDKRITVMSVNGPMVTTVEGRWDPVSTNGPAATRCAWLTNGALLNGFTLTGGATLGGQSGAVVSQNGGGALCSSSVDSLMVNCVISSNAAIFGGGVYYGKLLNCAILGNIATGPNANSPGGARQSRLVNCSIVGNRSHRGTGGVEGGYVTNCILYFNKRDGVTDDESLSNLYNSCAPEWIKGTNNIAADPQLVDAFHLALTSPCRGAGSPLAAAGADLDGETWLNPPSIGCDEVMESALVGPLVVAIESPVTELLVSRTLSLIGRVTGRAARLEWSFGDGPSVTNASFITSHQWTNPGDYTVTFTAFNYDNPGGVSAVLLVHALPLESPSLAAAGFSGTNFQLQFSSQSGVNYWVEYTTNLTLPITWQTLQSFTGTGGLESVTDVAATNAARFYRVRAQ